MRTSAHAIGDEVPATPDTGFAGFPFRRLGSLLAGRLEQKPALLSRDARKASALAGDRRCARGWRIPATGIWTAKLRTLWHAQTESSIHPERNKQGQVDRARSGRSSDHHRHWRSTDGVGFPHA